ncbi:pentapeptide repeat-containing protein [Rhizobium rhizogenes]|uniref:anti-phage Hailong system effector protein HalA n=1 Tax=Rhizobium rhizogenes TaxID=359 RepID=UPI0022CB7E03|nr:pentapeptide repeat-containing protein [Rhizobium rhizogenes]MCZ7452318.1 pentapeptide repeat-containing protein [Rhizobium rhizogenes]
MPKKIDLEKDRVEPRIREKRKSSFWEPVYDPTDSDVFPYSTWPEAVNERREHVTLSIRHFPWELQDKVVFSKVNFSKCDFEGDFTSFTPTFKGCKFEYCDFGFSKWKRAKFKDCTFTGCSFSIATFEECEFRGSLYSQIGLSGNETFLQGTTFTNPEKFLNSAYTCTSQKILKEKGRSIEYQLMRLEGTKATIARTLLHSSSNSGDEEIYYTCVKLYQNLSITSKSMEARFSLSEKPAWDRSILNLFQIINLRLEYLIINSVGWLNNWGASIAKPTLMGAFMVVLFAFLYWISSIKQTMLGALSASIDISLLVGFTKQANNSLPMGTKFIFTLNMIVGLIWYSVLLPTVVNRISRIR